MSKDSGVRVIVIGRKLSEYYRNCTQKKTERTVFQLRFSSISWFTVASASELK